LTVKTRLVSVEEFRELPLDDGAFRRELHHGEVVALTRPNFRHYQIQCRLQDLLSARSAGNFVGIEFAFRPLPEHELWCADVACVSRERMASIDPDDNLRGAPEMVIEVASPSNRWSDLYDRQNMCLENGGLEFWVVDPRHRTVTVWVQDTGVTYRAGMDVPLNRALFDEQALPVDEIFEGITDA
jgi:Uma2 family endonuclease